MSSKIAAKYMIYIIHFPSTHKELLQNCFQYFNCVITSKQRTQMIILKPSSRIMEILKTPEMLAMEEVLIVVSTFSSLIRRSPFSCPFMIILQAPKMLTMEEMLIMVPTFSSLIRRSPLSCPLVIILEAPKVLAMEEMLIMVSPLTSLFSRSSGWKRCCRRNEQQTNLKTIQQGLIIRALISNFTASIFMVSYCIGYLQLILLHHQSDGFIRAKK